ncbi:MAG: DUF2130 domain-containing protein, partial [Planctomycetes bacterium]|nr:DUF2130 domain-containing protein [Planctomycetota bacterium]
RPGVSKFEGETGYLSTALAPVVQTGERSLLSPKTITELELAGEVLGGYRLIVLCNVPRLDQAVWNRLTEFVTDGGGLLIFTGDAVNAEKSKAFNENLKFEEKLQELQRKLQKKTAEELGEGAEVDLFEALKTEFPSDQITRVNKGAAGADIIHKVVHNGQVCGCIIYDSKNRNAWRNDYVTKLRRDQLAAKADHAILSTQVFPAGARQLHIQDGVIVSNPARTVVLAQMLRKHVVQNHGLRLSNKARDQKTARLYEFITSERCAQLLDQIVTLTDDMLDLEVKEKKAHDATWKRRGEFIRSVQRTHGDFSAEIERIIGTAAAERQE